MAKMKQPRLPTGSSDPVKYTCTCSASSSSTGGLILLFYRYFTSPPFLPTDCLTPTSTSDLATFHTNLTESLHLGGKIRISDEGFNITVGGTDHEIREYIAQCISHWSFLGLELATEEQRNAFFKPSPGCACCFEGTCSVRITTEITPMGVTNYVPSNWDSITYLSPAEFHAKCLEEGEGQEEVVLLDVRNHYESRIGYFVSPRTGEKALTPEIRRFAQWPLYVRKRLAASLTSDDRSDLDGNEKNVEEKSQRRREKAILTYCTGGIRCEKGARFLADTLSTTSTTPSSQTPQTPQTKVYTLHGGISSYLAWIDSEIALGHKQPSDSLFKGQNYVFDSRGSVGLSPLPTTTTTSSSSQEQAPVSACQTCNAPSSRLSKCASKGCHLILVICAACDQDSLSPPRCCASCEAMDRAPLPTSAPEDGEKAGRRVPRPICECERERERQLWGDDSFGRVARPEKQVKGLKAQRRRDENGRGEGVSPPVVSVDELEIRLKMIS